MHDDARRRLLGHSAAVAALLAGLGRTSSAHAAGVWAGKGAFEAKTLSAVLQTMGLAAPIDSNQVTLSGPDVAENGAVVPFTLATTAPDAQQLLLLVEKNPNALAAVFTLSADVEPVLATRVKMSESSNVYAVAITGDRRVLFTRKDVRVVLGGCGS